jgi:adenylate cyclase
MWKVSRAYSIASILAAAAILPWGLLQPRPLDDSRNFVFDTFQRIAPRAYDPQTPARVVGVDEASLEAFGQWPWPRTRLAELTTRLRDLGAAAIAFDFIFAEPDRASFENLLPAIEHSAAREKLAKVLAGAKTNDQIFAAAITGAPVVLGVALTDDPEKSTDFSDKIMRQNKAGATDPPQKAGFVFAGDDAGPFLAAFSAIVLPLSPFSLAARGLGATNWLPDRDQIVRRVPLLGAARGQPVASLALEALRVAQGETTYVVRASNASGQSAFGRRTGVNAIKVGAFEIATGAGADIRPRYSFAHPARDISAARVLRGEIARSEIEGRIVFVGALAAGLGDVRATPLEPSVAGVDIHAQIVESLVSGALLSRPDWAPGLEFVVAALAFAVVMALLSVASPFVSAAMGVGAIAALFAGSFVLFDAHGLLLDPAYPSVTIVAAYLVGAVTLWRLEQVAKRHVYRAFGKFLAPAVVDRLVEHPERLVLGGETRELTVLFSDLRDFSALSEGMSARQLTQFMNDYLTPMTDAILECDGTIDKYMGDAILAFWNAPLDVPDHARKAATAALHMRSALEAFNEARARAASDHRPVAMGLGLALGPCSVGNMGSIRRFDYSILGDTVNLASRLDGACKTFKADIVAARELRDAAPDFAWLDLGEVVVVGRLAATRVFVIAGDANFSRTPAFRDWREKHDAMREAYESARFARAAAAAGHLSQWAPPPWRDLYCVMEKRFSTLRDSPPTSDWSPIWTLDSK